MAANAPAPSAAAKDGSALSSFDRISKIVYLYRPQPAASDRNSSASTAAATSPKLILIGGWMDAREPHLAKYTARLQALYPDSPILLVRSFVYHFTGRRFPREVEPAVPIIRSLMAAAGAAADSSSNSQSPAADDDSGSKQRPEMLVHVFSNGGSTMLRLLYDQYRKSARARAHDAAGEESGALPPHVTVFDSAPGRWSWQRSVTAFTLAAARRSFVVRLFVWALSNTLNAFYWICTVPWGRRGFLERTGLAHNDPTKNQSEVRRVYIYSEEDQLVDYKDIEEHAAQGREHGYETRLEKFEGTAHVAHARGDEQRYWTIVRETWQGGPAS